MRREPLRGPARATRGGFAGSSRTLAAGLAAWTAAAARPYDAAGMDPLRLDRPACFGVRHRPDTTGGHYESWFLRANHPSEPLAVWIRYTIFAAKGGTPVRGELWAIWFDGRGATTRIHAAKSELPLSQCRFAPDHLDVTIGDARLHDHGAGVHASGDAQRDGTAIAWSLHAQGDAPPLLLLSRDRYATALPKAKALVGLPDCRIGGTVTIDGEPHVLDGWPGSVNHNWGSRHTDRYGWVQVIGFDEDPTAVLESISARLRFGPLSTPWLTVAVLREGGREHRFDGIARSAFGRVTQAGLSLRCRVGNREGERLQLHAEAPEHAFVGLRYDNPPGGAKLCRNCKLATVSVVLEGDGRAPLRLHTANRGALELVDDDLTAFPIAL